MAIRYKSLFILQSSGYSQVVNHTNATGLTHVLGQFLGIQIFGSRSLTPKVELISTLSNLLLFFFLVFSTTRPWL